MSSYWGQVSLAEEELEKIPLSKPLHHLNLYRLHNLKRLKGNSQIYTAKSLLISECSNLVDLTCLKYFSQLEKLYVSDCSKLKSLKEVKAGRRLISIVVKNCPNLKEIPKALKPLVEFE